MLVRMQNCLKVRLWRREEGLCNLWLFAQMITPSANDHNDDDDDDDGDDDDDDDDDDVDEEED